jgi:OOP family OmpA-OmpF porin
MYNFGPLFAASPFVTFTGKAMSIKYLAAAALSLAAATASAGPAGLYAGVGAGATRFDDLDSNKAHYGAFVGYGFNQTFAFEVGHTRHGGWEYHGTEVKLQRTDFTMVGATPLGRDLDLYARVGYAYGRLDSELAKTRGEDDIDSGIFGVGLGYRFSPKLSARVELQRPFAAGTSGTASLVWTF